MRILFLSAWYPYPPDNGSKLRIYNLLRGLSQKHDVAVITLQEVLHEALSHSHHWWCRVHWVQPG